MADTVANIVSEAAVEAGLGAVSDVYASIDANVVQLRTLLKGLGQDLIDEHDWQILDTEYTFSTANGTAAYSLPSDYAREIPETLWNRTTAWPVGVMSPQAYQENQAFTHASLVNKFARVKGGQIIITPTPSATETVAFEYISKNWVSATGGTAPTKDAPSANSDLIWFDRRLIILGLKLRFLEAKGFAVDAPLMAYRDRLESQKAGDALGQTIYFGGRRRSPRRISKWNIPDTGVGS